MPEITYMRIMKKYLAQGSFPPDGIMHRLGQLLVSRRMRQLCETMGIDMNTLKKHEYEREEL